MINTNSILYFFRSLSILTVCLCYLIHFSSACVSSANFIASIFPHFVPPLELFFHLLFQYTHNRLFSFVFWLACTIPLITIWILIWLVRIMLGRDTFSFGVDRKWGLKHYPFVLGCFGTRSVWLTLECTGRQEAEERPVRRLWLLQQSIRQA